jgi:hypothetical protein
MKIDQKILESSKEALKNGENADIFLRNLKRNPNKFAELQQRYHKEFNRRTMEPLYSNGKANLKMLARFIDYLAEDLSNSQPDIILKSDPPLASTSLIFSQSSIILAEISFVRAREEKLLAEGGRAGEEKLYRLGPLPILQKNGRFFRGEGTGIEKLIEISSREQEQEQELQMSFEF